MATFYDEPEETPEDTRVLTDEMILREKREARLKFIGLKVGELLLVNVLFGSVWAVLYALVGFTVWDAAWLWRASEWGSAGRFFFAIVAGILAGVHLYLLVWAAFTNDKGKPYPWVERCFKP